MCFCFLSHKAYCWRNYLNISSTITFSLYWNFLCLVYSLTLILFSILILLSLPIITESAPKLIYLSIYLYLVIFLWLQVIMIGYCSYHRTYILLLAASHSPGSGINIYFSSCTLSVYDNIIYHWIVVLFSYH